jgi:hypothetical protein
MKNKHIGSRLDDFLAEDGLLEDANAIKRVIAWQLGMLELAAKNDIWNSEVLEAARLKNN